jgi:protein involved in polysaccharide export with SLBB domain
MRLTAKYRDNRTTHPEPRCDMMALAFLSLVMLTGGCAKQESPEDTAAWGAPPPYLLQPGDEVEIKFFYAPQLNEREAIRPDGKLNLPLLDPNPVAAGLTVDQLHDSLMKEYGSILRSPDIQVVLRTAAEQRFFVAGQVTTQGALPITGPTRVSQAVTMAQGLKPTAYKSELVILRRLPDGRTLTRKVDYNKIIAGKAPEQDILLAAGDIVYVPQTALGNVDDFVTQIRAALPFSTDAGVNYTFGQTSQTVQTVP